MVMVVNGASDIVCIYGNGRTAISAHNLRRPSNSLPVSTRTHAYGMEFPDRVIIKSATCMWFVIN